MKSITDKVFEVIEVLKENGTIRFYADVYHNINLPKQNFNAIKNRRWDFTTQQIYLFINHFNVNANYIFKNSPKMFDTNNTQIVKKTEHTLFSNN